MTPLPKRKISTRRKGKRRSSQKLKLPSLTNCKYCGKKKIYRQICPNCQK